MIKKFFSVVALLFLMQFVSSCINQLKCPESNTFEEKYIGLDPYFGEKQGNGLYNILSSEEITEGDTLRKDSLVLVINTVFDLANKKTAASINFGFNPAMALDCLPQYIVSDQISNVEVFTYHQQTEERQTITSSFSFYSFFTNGHLPKEEYLKELSNSNEFQEEIGMKLIDTAPIGDSAIFEVEVELQSGKTLHTRYKRIKFY